MLTWWLATAARVAAQAPVGKADEAAYTRTIEKRADDVLGELRLNELAIAGRVRGIVIDQYRGLRSLHDARDAKVAQILADGTLEGPTKVARIEAERASTRNAAAALNDRFLARLAADLSPTQVESVMDKMTYHKLQVTYNGYLEMLPKLADEQKRAVFEILKKARDEAVYAGSSEEKTAIFGRYKGRVNNYLSSEGYDLKLAAKEWADRRNAAK